MCNWRSSLTLEQPPVKNHFHLKLFKLCKSAYISFTTGLFSTSPFHNMKVLCYLSPHERLNDKVKRHQVWLQREVGAGRLPVFYNIFPPQPLDRYPGSQDRALASPIWDHWVAWGAVSKNIEDDIKLNRFNLLDMKNVKLMPGGEVYA